MKKINLKGVSAQTWARTIALLLALISQLLVIIGKKSEAIDIEQWQEYASYIVTIVCSVMAWWKNNSFTKNAQVADDIKDSPELVNGRGE